MDFAILNNALREKVILNGVATDVTQFLQKEDTMHIAYGIDTNFIRPMGVAMTSIVENNPNRDFAFHVLMEELPEEEKENFRKFSEKYQAVVIFYFIDAKVFAQLPSTEHFTKATYNRFLLPKVLRHIAKKVIYLDADILCLQRMDELVALDFQGNTVAVVQDINSVADKQIKALGLEDKRYFNAGFLYIDVDRWNEEQISEKALQISFDRLGELAWLDQDALNLVLQGKSLFISQKYDFIFDLGHKKYVHVLALPEDAALVHYAGRYKPWHSWCMHPLRCDFAKYAALSFWAEVPLIAPNGYKDMKKMGKSYMEYQQIGKGLFWYAKYAYYKTKEKLGWS